MKIPTTRCDGWTDQRRDIFIAALTAGQSVVRACAAAGPSASTAYRLYRRDAGFAARWDKVFADRRAAMAARPMPSREHASVSQVVRWLGAGTRHTATQGGGDPVYDLDSAFMTFVNADGNRRADR